jgi:hypothetical protein
MHYLATFMGLHQGNSRQIYFMVRAEINDSNPTPIQTLMKAAKLTVPNPVLIYSRVITREDFEALSPNVSEI